MATTTDATFHRTKLDVAEKVRKLLAKAEDPAATPEEAESLTAKAQQLMTKYAIDLAMVADGPRAGQFVERWWLVEGPYAAHKVSIINAVARANDCRAIYTDLRGGRKRIDVVGYPTDVEWVETLSRSLEVQLASALTAALRHKDRDVHGRTFSVAFVQGFATEIATRLQRARRAAVAEADAARAAEDRPGPSAALVLVEKSERVDQEFMVRYPRARTVHHRVRLLSWSGYDPGRAAGRAATLARGAVSTGRRPVREGRSLPA
ncbi:MAG TPA: DUF2786 domain-containing protein [Acidimicrobiales bacterium]|nr:DUF2786 domain-containing protein [Acidimicrobiales bacterium]